jgi:formylglycine-generating enzyme required for sulfatase activity
MSEDDPRAELERQVAELEAELQKKRAVLAVTGSGAVAGGSGSTAGGANSLVVSGEAGNVTKVDAHAGAVVNLGNDGGVPKGLRQEYLAGLLDEAGSADLAGIAPSVIESEGRDYPRLASIYTSLRVRGWSDDGMEREVGVERELPAALAAVDRERHLVLLGEPGSGKSTFLRFLAVSLAGELIGHSAANLKVLRQPLPDEDGEEEEELQPWSAPTLLPVLVTLRDLAATGLPSVGKKATAEHVWRFLKDTVPRGFFPALREELNRDGGFLLFDGLDEVPQAENRREQLIGALKAFVGALPNSRVVVTCRTYAYQKPAWRLRDFAVAELAPFDDGQIRRFVRLWYEDAARRGSGVKASVAPARAEVLVGAIERNRHIRALAERPLLLTLMASLHAFGGRELPERREDLYAQTVELLLFRWEKQRRDKTAGAEKWQPSLVEWLETSGAAIRGVLEKLAFEVHERQPEAVGTADIAQGELASKLLELRKRPEDNPGELLDYLHERTGLLEPRGIGVFSFPHRSFQEYLAACHLARRQDYPDQLSDLTRTDPDRWREVALLAAATAAATNPGPRWDLVGALCRRAPSPQSAKADAWGAHIAAQVLLEPGPPASVPERHVDKVENLRAWLLKLLTSPHLPARERALAGRNLAMLGDPREGVTTLDAMEFCWVPPGPFWMGDEGEEKELDLADGYWMARFPVTGAQWREYVSASGAEVGNCDSLAIAANEPVFWVSWDEAEAFCRWLTERWNRAGLLPAGWTARLPSEEEWEKAARGGLQVPVEAQSGRLGALKVLEPRTRLKPNPEKQRSYPWEGPAEAERANYDETHIGRPSAVGAFPAGKSAYGCEELSGNVWEWTRSLYKPGDESLRVLRGGAYFLDARSVRCSYRSGNFPDARNGIIGFRVLLSPFFSEP